MKLHYYGWGKVVLCRQCYEKHWKITAIFLESVFLQSLIIYLITLPAIFNIVWVIIELSFLIGIAVLIPLIYPYRIRKY